MKDFEYQYEHTHEPDDPLNKQHGPNSHTHGKDGQIDTRQGQPVKRCKRCNPGP